MLSLKEFMGSKITSTTQLFNITGGEKAWTRRRSSDGTSSYDELTNNDELFDTTAAADCHGPAMGG